MRLTEKLFILILGIALVPGCISLEGAPKPPRPTSVALADPEYLVEPSDLRDYERETNPNEKEVLRNKIIDERLLEVDRQFELFETKLWQEGTGSGIGTDWALLAVGGLTTTLKGESTKAALGAIQTGIVGAKASFDKNTYMNKTLPAIMAQMVAERETIRLEIKRNQKLPVSDYTIYTALSDIRKFMRAGTLFGAIQGIAKDAGEKTKAASYTLSIERSKDFVNKKYQDRIDKILVDINELGIADANELNEHPPILDSKIDELVKRRDPNGLRYKDRDKAREMLRFRIVMSERTDENLNKWEAALKAMKK